MWRSTGAIFWLTRPATIIRSACRGLARNTSMPKRAESNRGAPKVIISIAQHARPNVAGHNDDLRVQLTSFSIDASSTPSGSFSSIPTSLVPIQAAAAPHVGVGDEHGDDEQDDLDQPEQAERLVGDGVRVQEDDLDVEDDEQHRRQEVLDREAVRAERLRGRLDAALVEVQLRLVVAPRTGERRDADREDGERRRQREQQQNRQGRRQHLSAVLLSSDGAGEAFHKPILARSPLYPPGGT